MRRSDREIQDIGEIYDMLERCNSLNLGMAGEDGPYVVPMTFGTLLRDGKITVYLHCAGEGKKLDLLKKDNRVCVEAHIYERTERTEGGITARYESVIGFGRAVFAADKAEKIEAFKLMLAHYKASGFPVTSCKGLDRSEVIRIELDEVTGKRNMQTDIQ